MLYLQRCVDRVYLPPAPAVEVIESVLSMCLCVCERSHGQTVSPGTLVFWSYLFVICECVSIHHNKRTFGQKGCTLGRRGRYVNAQAFSLFNNNYLVNSFNSW